MLYIPTHHNYVVQAMDKSLENEKKKMRSLNEKSTNNNNDHEGQHWIL